MNIVAPCVVALTWTLSDAQGQLIDELTEPVEFFYGGQDLLPKVEEALAGHSAGFSTLLHLEPEHAFGDYDADLVCFEARSLFPETLEPGMRFDGLPHGAVTADLPEGLIYTVTEIYPGHAVLDANHPLAGMALRIEVEVKSARQATAEEIQQGSVGESPFTLVDKPQTSMPLH